MTDNEHYSLHIVIAAILTICIVGLVLGLGTPLVSILMKNEGFSSAVIGYNGTVGGFATIIAAACTSKIAVKFGVARSILTMMLIGAMSFLGFYFIPSLIAKHINAFYFLGFHFIPSDFVWFVLRFILHFAMTVMFILSEFWVNYSAPTRHRGLVLSLYALSLGIGFALGPTILTIFGSQGFTPFGIVCVLIVVAMLPYLFSLKLSPQFHEHKQLPFVKYIFTIPTSNMAVFVCGAVQMAALTLIVPFSAQIGYTNDNDGATFIQLLSIGYVLLLMPIGMISDRIKDRRYALLSCAIIGFIGVAIVPLIYQSKVMLGADLFILGGASAGLYIIALAQLGARYKSTELAAANSAFIFCYGMGMLVGPALIGLAMDFFPPFGFSNAVMVFFALYIILVLSRLILRLFRS